MFENSLKAIRQMRGGSFIHSIHFPVLRNTIMRKMKTGRRTGIGSPPWMQTETSGPEISCGMWRSVPSQPWSPNFLQSKHCPRYPKVQAETEQRMQTCLKKGFQEHKCHIRPTCYELRWAEGTETFTGFTSAMACGQARLTRAAHSKWMTWKRTEHHVLDTCRIHSPSLKNVVARFWEVCRNESTKPE